MIRSAVTVSLVAEAKGGPFVFWDDLPAACRKTKELGYDAIELFPPGPDAVDAAELRRLLAGEGLSLAAVGTGAGWVKHKLHLCLPDAAAKEGVRVYPLIEFAAANNAPVIIGSMQGRTSEAVDHPTALAYLSAALEELGAYAQTFGVSLFHEPLNRYETNLVNTVAAGVKLLQALSTRNVKLLADLFHMNIEETDIAAALRAGEGCIGHLHFVDSNRRPAGLGHLDYGPIAAALREIGYAGYASAEALPYPDSDAAARQTIDKYWEVFRGQTPAE